MEFQKKFLEAELAKEKEMRRMSEEFFKKEADLQKEKGKMEVDKERAVGALEQVIFLIFKISITNSG